MNGDCWNDKTKHLKRRDDQSRKVVDSERIVSLQAQQCDNENCEASIGLPYYRYSANQERRQN